MCAHTHTHTHIVRVCARFSASRRVVTRSFRWALARASASGPSFNEFHQRRASGPHTHARTAYRDRARLCATYLSQQYTGPARNILTRDTEMPGKVGAPSIPAIPSAVHNHGSLARWRHACARARACSTAAMRTSSPRARALCVCCVYHAAMREHLCMHEKLKHTRIRICEYICLCVCVFTRRLGLLYRFHDHRLLKLENDISSLGALVVVVVVSSRPSPSSSSVVLVCWRSLGQTRQRAKLWRSHWACARARARTGARRRRSHSAVMMTG